MNLQTLRPWATPLTIGSFALMATTGILMFFHLDSGLNKVAHEWLGWAMVAGVALHATVNWAALKRHLLANRVIELAGHDGRERLAAIEARHDALDEF